VVTQRKKTCEKDLKACKENDAIRERNTLSGSSIVGEILGPGDQWEGGGTGAGKKEQNHQKGGRTMGGGVSWWDGQVSRQQRTPKGENRRSHKALGKENERTTGADEQGCRWEKRGGPVPVGGKVTLMREAAE